MNEEAEGKWVRLEDGHWYWNGTAPPVFVEPTPLQKLVVRAITLSLVVVLPLGAIFFVNRNQTNNRVASNQDTIQREREIRQRADDRIQALALHFNNVQKWTEFDNCVSDEYQDAVIVSLLRLVPKDQRPPAVQDAIDGLEPPVDDRECVPPTGPRPRETNP